MQNFDLFASRQYRGSAGYIWRSLLMDVLYNGLPVGPRGRSTKELLNVSLVTNQLQECAIYDRIRNLNYRFMVAEAFWIALGLEGLEPLTRYNQHMAMFSDNGETLAGAYGPRLKSQWPYVIQKLREDQSSRQAVASIWTPSPSFSLDIPCTISFQFLVRGDKLHTIVNMRSSDLWLGLPYDIFSFSFIGLCVAGSLALEPGKLAMNLGSSHLYEEHYDLASSVFDGDDTLTFSVPRVQGFPTSSFDEYAWRSSLVHLRPFTDMLRARTSIEALDVLREYQVWID